jgi:hypothetical protein
LAAFSVQRNLILCVRLFSGWQIFNPCPYFLMGQEFAAAGGLQSLSYLAEKPLVIVHQALYCLPRKRFRVAALLRDKMGESVLKVGVETYFHLPSE